MGRSAVKAFPEFGISIGSEEDDPLPPRLRSLVVIR